MRQIWIDAGAPAADDCRIGQRGDPYVIYDHLADRFVLTQFANDRMFGAGDVLRIQCIAVAQGPDPVNDGWFAYTFNLGFSNDYPKFGVWPDGYYMISQRGYGSLVVDATVFDRATMLNGGAATFQSAPLAGGLPNQTIVMLPSELQGPPPPAGSPNYYVRMIDGDLFGLGPGQDQIQIREFAVDWGVPANTTLGNLTTLSPSEFSSDICAGANLFNYCIDQPVPSIDKLEALSVWPMAPANYRNFGTHESLVFNHTVDVDGAGLAGIRWYELRRVAGVWTLYQEGTFSPPDGTNTHRWMASISQDKDGNMALGYSVSNDGTGTDVFPGIRYTGRLATDPLGLMPAGEYVMVAGTSAANVGDNTVRWGDYSTMRVDPVDGCTFWYTKMYVAGGIQTQIGAFRFPSCNPVDLVISKSDSPDPVVAGDQLNYTIFVRNDGPSQATNVVVTDMLPVEVEFLASSIPCISAPPNLTCDIGTLEDGESTSFTIQVRVPADFLSSQGVSTDNISNTVSVVSDQQDSDPSNNTDTESTNVIESSDLRLTKTCKPDGPTQAGEDAFCQITVENLGVSDAQDVVVTDDILSNAPFTVASVVVSPSGTCLPATPIGPASDTTLTCDLGIEPAGGVTTITVNIASDGAADVNDTATVTSSTPDPDNSNNQDFGEIHFVAGTDLSISKTGPASAIAGESIVYTLTVANLGPSGATNVVVTDLLPPEVDYVGDSPSQGSCSESTQTVTCTLGSLADGAGATIDITVTVKPDTPTGTTLVNKADITSDDADPDNGNNSDNLFTSVGTDADLSVTKSDSPDPVLAGEILTYDVVVANAGPSSAVNVLLEDTLPAGVSFQGYVIANGSGSCSLLPGDLVSCNLNTIHPAQFARVIITVLVDIDVPNGTVLTNTAVASSDTTDPNGANDSASEDTTVNARADVSITKDASIDTSNPAPRITYTLVVANNGPSDALDVTVLDTLPLTPKKIVYVFDTGDGACAYDAGAHTVGCDFGTLVTGASVSVDIIVDARGGVKEITNTATVATTTTDPNLANNTAVKIVRVKGGPGGGGGGGNSNANANGNGNGPK